MIDNKLRHQTDLLWMKLVAELQPRCWICLAKAEDVHHYWRKGHYAYLRYDLDNGVSCCRPHHDMIDQHEPEVIKLLIARRGQEWYDRLLLKKNSKPQYFSFNNSFIRQNYTDLKAQLVSMHAF